jgi:RNA-directed DNA polymerase
MTAISKLRSIRNRNELALMLGFKPSKMAGILYATPEASKYVQFKIDKKDGGVRDISSPIPPLKMLQKNLSNLLYQCLDERVSGATFKSLNNYGYMRRFSVIDNAKRHRNRKFVLNVDIQDFFGSINFGRVRGFFLKDSFFNPSYSPAG